ncbi:MAG: PhzF family phenazine biosynthesis protein [Beijerinckiaceae bacterium]
MAMPYFILDVFTEHKLAGNQLAVVRDCEHLSDEQMHAIAREFNLPETIFVLPPRDPVNTARLRIFTPAIELPFAGHPTIGGAVLIAQEDARDMLGRQELVIAIEEQVGLIHCSVRKPPGKAARAVFDLPQLPKRLDGAPPRDDLARALALSADDIGFGTHVPSHYSAGVGFVFVPVASLEAIGRAKPNLGVWDSVFSHPQGRGCYVYTQEVASEASHVHARMFAPPFGITEDPATGGAAAAFAGVCMEFEQPGDGEHQVVIEQGLEMGRPSEIVLSMTVQGGALIQASIGGAAVLVANGTLQL